MTVIATNFVERTDSAWRRAAKAWLSAKEQEAKTRARLLDLAGDESAYGAGVKAARYFEAGRVNYKSIPELEDVDLDRYRGLGTWRYRLSAQ